MIRVLRAPGLAVRLASDTAMGVLFVVSLAFRATGREAHEWIGMLFCLLFMLHSIWNRGWYGNLFRRRYSASRTMNTVTNLALLVVVVVLCACGILNSRHIFGFSQFVDGENIRQIHSVAAYWGVVIIGIHSGLHWEMVWTFMSRTFGLNRESKGATHVGRLAALCFAVFGVWASYDRDMGAKLFMGFSFDFWNPGRPLILFFACNLAIMVLYGSITHYAQSGLKRLSRARSQKRHLNSQERRSCCEHSK